MLKCFEVANSLADTVLLTFAGSHPGFELGPQDFLHALYHKLLPFLEQDSVLNSILRSKTAEVLVMAPARLLTMELDDISFQGQTSWVSKKNDFHCREQQETESYSVLGYLDEQLVLPADHQTRPQPSCLDTE